MTRAPIITFLLALALGVGMGLYIGWIAYPTQYTNTDPTSLRQDYKDGYVLMIATLYAQEGNLAAAQSRLLPLGPNPGQLVATTAGRLMTAQAPEADLRHLAHLGAGLGYVTPEMQRYLEP